MINHLSYSSISKYLKCGKQWKFRYLDKAHENPSEALFTGSVFHKMIRYYLINNGEKSLDSCWELAFNRTIEEGNSNNDWLENVNFLGQKMLTSEKITDTIQGLSVDPESLELPTELHIPGVPIPIVGFIDMIGLDGIPIDIKTSSSRWTEPSKSNGFVGKADKELQATFYLAALEQAGLITLPHKFRYLVFTKTKNPVVQDLETTRTHADVFALYGLVNEVWQAIQREVFMPTDPNNWWCSHKYCSFWDVCEYGGKNG